MSEDLIAEGRRLIAAATPGPLEVDALDPYDVITRRYEPVAEHESRAGATLHVFAVNNLAALLDVAEAAGVACERLDGGAGEQYYREVVPGFVGDIEALRDALDSALSKLRGSRAS